MNQGGYYGAYRQGFKTLPDNAYQMMTAPTQQNAKTIGMVTSAIGGAVGANQAAQAGTEAFKQGSAAQYSGLESLSQATGVPVNPELANQYLNMGQMSPQQQAVFQTSLAEEAKRMQMLYGINQAQARAAQAQQGQGMQQFGSQIDYMIAGRNQRAAPAPAPAPVNSGGFQISNAGIANIMGQTGTGLRFGQ